MQIMIAVFEIGKKKYFVDLSEKGDAPLLTLFVAFRAEMSRPFSARYALLR